MQQASFKFPKNQKLIVHLFDISKAEGWSMGPNDIWEHLLRNQERMSIYWQKVDVVPV